MEALEILYEDAHYIAINKPAGVMVHKTPLERDPDALFAVQMLRDQIGQKVNPLHRLDRPTSGVLLFAKSSDAAARLQPDFANQKITKNYLAVVRGYLPDTHGFIDSPLAKDLTLDLQPAKTEFWCIDRAEIPFASSPRYASSRYSLVRIYPHTGRMHQIRRHFAQFRHYVIGDTTHGDNKQNNFFRRHFRCDSLLLHAWHMSFYHPYDKSLVTLHATPPGYFCELLAQLGWKVPTDSPL
ncbi:tRNA pseudouridine synthase C [Lunatimonas lonarensis]|uniref:tRNA pseudouridine synthase C n=1 Tax=Lunatimonas lonarensis TaxID=1232681 RepID=R7ZQV0_9BACT|nr:pseudouridine synthase [Lunatimonas lonarensis]EON76389.1 tRNA pseudouridine synthase C [Lunatimonas lonarensis]